MGTAKWKFYYGKFLISVVDGRYEQRQPSAGYKFESQRSLPPPPPQPPANRHRGGDGGAPPGGPVTRRHLHSHEGFGLNDVRQQILQALAPRNPKGPVCNHTPPGAHPPPRYPNAPVFSVRRGFLTDPPPSPLTPILCPAPSSDTGIACKVFFCDGLPPHILAWAPSHRSRTRASPWVTRSASGPSRRSTADA